MDTNLKKAEIEAFIKTFKSTRLYKILGEDVKREIDTAIKDDNMLFLNSIHRIVMNEQEHENSLMENLLKSQEDFIADFMNQMEEIRRKFVLRPMKLKIKREEKKDRKKADKILENLNN